MALSYEVCVKLPLKDAPQWLSHLEFTRQGDEILIQIVKTNDLPYGDTRISIEDFNQMADTLLTPGS